MTIEGAIAELQNLIKADDVPFYYNGAIQKVIETIIDERPVRCGECKYLEVINKAPIYAHCHKWDYDFELWQEDTRKSFCSYGEGRADDNKRRSV